MRTIKLYAAIDLLEGEVVRVRKGALEDKTVYGSDPVAMARQWADAGADGIHLVDLRGAVAGKYSAIKLLEKLCRALRAVHRFAAQHDDDLTLGGAGFYAENIFGKHESRDQQGDQSSCADEQAAAVIAPATRRFLCGGALQCFGLVHERNFKPAVRVGAGGFPASSARSCIRRWRASGSSSARPARREIRAARSTCRGSAAPVGTAHGRKAP